MEEKPVVVLDTNVFVSGLLSPAGAPGLILRRFRQRDFEIATSKEQIREIQLVLKRPTLEKAIPKGTAKEVMRFFISFKRLAQVHNPPKLNWEFKDKGVSIIQPSQIKDYRSKAMSRPSMMEQEKIR